MSIAFSCPDCDKKFNVPDSMAGRTAKCSGCGVIIDIPNTVGITARPSARSRGPAAYEEEPARKKRPSRRAPDEDEPDYEDDAPIRSRRKKGTKPAKKSGVMALVLLLVGFTALLGIAGVGGGVAWWYFRDNSVDPLKFAPDNCKMIVVMNMEQLEGTKAYDAINGGSSAWNNDQVGIPTQSSALKKARVSQVLVAAAISTGFMGGIGPIGGAPMSNDQAVVVVQTKDSISVDDLRNDPALKGPFTDSKVNGYTLYEGPSQSFCRLNNKQVLLGPAPVLRSVLNRDKKPTLSADLQAAITKADFTKPIAVAFDASGMSGPKEASAMELQWVAVQGTFGADINLTITTQSSSERGAQAVKKQADELVKTIKTLQSMAGALGQKQPALFDEPKMSVSGSTFTAEVTIKSEALAQSMKGQANPREGKPPAGNPPGNNPPGGNRGRPKP